MDLAKRFFLQEEDANDQNGLPAETYYERYQSDLKAIQEKLE